MIYINKTTWLILINTIMYIVMVAVNALANILPINNVGTGTVSDTYSNLFTPAPITFSIWVLIYLLLAGFVIYQYIGIKNEQTVKAINAIGLYFALSSLANTTWILAWHYFLIEISVLLMLIIFVCLAAIYLALNKIPFSRQQWFFIKLPFSVYFGWISIAAVANIVAFLTSLGWNNLFLPEQVWTVLIMLLASAAGIRVSLRYNDIAYALVFVWAYLGILIKHVSLTGFNCNYPGIIVTAVLCIIMLIAAIYSILKNKITSASHI